MKIITLYQYHEWDGGDRHVSKDICFGTQEEADRFLGGNKYDNFVKRTFTIFDDVEEYEQSKSEELKKTALAKLTDLEKRVLGLI